MIAGAIWAYRKIHSNYDHPEYHHADTWHVHGHARYYHDLHPGAFAIATADGMDPVHWVVMILSWALDC